MQLIFKNNGGKIFGEVLEPSGAGPFTQLCSCTRSWAWPTHSQVQKPFKDAMDQHGEHLQRQGNVILISSSLGFVPAGQALQRFLQFRNKWISTIGDALFSHRLSIRISSKDTGSAPQDSDEYLQ